MSTSNRLPVLAAEIAEHHTVCLASSREFVAAAVQAGRLLIEAKELLSHGEWVPWLQADLPTISVRTCQRYMRAAENAGKNDKVSFSSLRELLETKPRHELTEAPWFVRLPAGYVAEHMESWPQVIGGALRYLDAEGWSPSAIAFQLGITTNRIAKYRRTVLPHSPDLLTIGSDRLAEAAWGNACNAAWLRHRAGFAGSAAGYAAEAGQRRLVEPLRAEATQLRAEARELEPAIIPEQELVWKLAAWKRCCAWIGTGPEEQDGFLMDAVTLVEQIADGDPAAIATAFPADAWPPEVYAEVLESLAREAASFRGAAARWGAES